MPAEPVVRNVGRIEAPAEEQFAEHRADEGVHFSVPESWPVFVETEGDVSFDAGDIYFEIKRIEKTEQSSGEALGSVISRWSEDYAVLDSRTEAVGGCEAMIAEIRQEYTDQVTFCYHAAVVDAEDRYYVICYQTREADFERYDAVFGRILDSVRIETLPDAGDMLTLDVPEISEDTFPAVREIPEAVTEFSFADVPAFTDEAVFAVSEGPYFTEEEITDRTFLSFSAFDELGRCGAAVGCLGQELTPEENRGSIGAVKPSGWHTVKYDGIDGNYLYNRCHLIGYQLCGENANELNLITGTRYMNVQGMEPFESMTADYIASTGNHVMYRATPVFEGEDLVARGVLLEAQSVEENDFSFCVFCYNVQPGVVIDYATGESEGKEFSGNE